MRCAAIRINQYRERPPPPRAQKPNVRRHLLQWRWLGHRMDLAAKPQGWRCTRRGGSPQNPDCSLGYIILTQDTSRVLVRWRTTIRSRARANLPLRRSAVVIGRPESPVRDKNNRLISICYIIILMHASPFGDAFAARGRLWRDPCCIPCPSHRRILWHGMKRA